MSSDIKKENSSTIEKLRSLSYFDSKRLCTPMIKWLNTKIEVESVTIDKSYNLLVNFKIVSKQSRHKIQLANTGNEDCLDDMTMERPLHPNLILDDLEHNKEELSEINANWRILSEYFGEEEEEQVFAIFIQQLFHQWRDL